MLSNKFDYRDFIKSYVDEQLDRQVFWFLQKVPELDFEDKKVKK